MVNLQKLLEKFNLGDSSRPNASNKENQLVTILDQPLEMSTN